jgi:hypothetical protein
MKSLSYYVPFGKKEDNEMITAKAKANLQKLAQLINICSFLIQKKVYLLPRKPKQQQAEKKWVREVPVSN